MHSSENTRSRAPPGRLGKFAFFIGLNLGDACRGVQGSTCARGGGRRLPGARRGGRSRGTLARPAETDAVAASGGQWRRASARCLAAGDSHTATRRLSRRAHAHRAARHGKCQAHHRPHADKPPASLAAAVHTRHRGVFLLLAAAVRVAGQASPKGK